MHHRHHFRIFFGHLVGIVLLSQKTEPAFATFTEPLVFLAFTSQAQKQQKHIQHCAFNKLFAMAIVAQRPKEVHLNCLCSFLNRIRLASVTRVKWTELCYWLIRQRDCIRLHKFSQCVRKITSARCRLAGKMI